MAKLVGQQLKQLGEAVNGYINIRYDKLSTLTSSSSQSSDPAPVSVMLRTVKSYTRHWLMKGYYLRHTPRLMLKNIHMKLY